MFQEGNYKTGLSVACVPRSVTFLNTLVICNGAEVWDFIKEYTATFFIRTGDRSFSFRIDPRRAARFNYSKYQNNNQIQLKFEGGAMVTTVNTVAWSDENLITITIPLPYILPDFAPGSETELFYRDWPPSVMCSHVSRG